ncbi:hypothetical protein PGT21_014487 [Puccinia graminis f. sp. tritici]|uniref:Uncharacterized protein n=1 Tax=Puccinia graminis f. sp. tritici TaxID=56615 RepID=A0A5B0PS11_PUCGR|nr:hypothetical protein PGT21_014487 [Puccinia graminis f. sp. tritici]
MACKAQPPSDPPRPGKYTTITNNTNEIHSNIMVDEASKRATRSNLQKGPKHLVVLDNSSRQPNASTDSTSTMPSQINTPGIGEETGPRETLELDSESDESDTFKDTSDNPKDPASNISKYKDMLSNVPEITTTDELAVTHKNPAGGHENVEDPNVVPPHGHPSEPTQANCDLLVVSAPKSDKSILWDKIAEAVAANDKVNADFFIRLYSQINEDSGGTKPDILRSRSNDAVNSHITSSASKKPSEKTSIIFVRGSLPKHFDVGFTPYFDKNIKELRGPIPLTIFDKKWQEEAIQFHTNKRSKGDEKEGNHTGYEYPNEWTQTFAKWTANHRNFHVTFRDLYNYPDFADWILEHKANVDRIIAEDGFLVGFRYDLIVRQNAFSYQVETDQGTSAVDISIFRKDVKREAWKVTRNLEELDFSDNPYAKDGPKFNFDPQTGKPKISKSKISEESNHHGEHRNATRGRGGFRQGRGLDRFNQERRNSDFGSYREESYGYEHKRPRENYHGDDNSHNRYEYSNNRGGYGKDRGSSGRGGSSRTPSRSGSNKGKEKDIP